jgi:hypothetical protein
MQGSDNAHMFKERSSARPLVLAVGLHRDGLGLPHPELRDAVDDTVDARHVDVASVTSGGRALLREATAAAAGDGLEAVHLFDARLAPYALLARRRLGVAVSATLSSRDVGKRSLPRRLLWPMISRLDQAFVSHEALARAVAQRSRRLAVAVTPPSARPLVAPSARALERVTRLLHGIAPGRLVVAMLWPADREHLRRYRDAVAPLLIGNPVTLMLGAPNRREARIALGPQTGRNPLRAHVGQVDADLLSAALRCSDAAVLVGPPRGLADCDEVVLAIAASRIPLVAAGALESDLLHAERNALTVEPGDAFGLVTTLNKLLALPAQQRHCLGVEFADYTLDCWTPAAAAEAYAERFYSLVGRPLIPADLRAA